VILALLLWLSEHRHETNQVQIAQYSKLDKMTVSQALKKLTLQGLVHRSEHEADTRAKHVMLTAQGIELVQKLVPLVEGVDAQFFGRLSKDAEQTLIKTLGPLVEGAG
jgi:DNA-binding MarR family transcriptional regulator